MLLPAFKGVDAVASLADVATGFVNPRGFVMVNEYQQCIHNTCKFIGRTKTRSTLCRTHNNWTTAIGAEIFPIMERSLRVCCIHGWRLVGAVQMTLVLSLHRD
jgi:hypothetical protein